MSLRPPYPEIEPYHTGFLKVSDLHTLYYEESGNPQGQPIVFLHGGPGGGTAPGQRRFFDPQFYRIILFDQRGCGKSTPFAELGENTTWDLVDDIEKLRQTLGIERWVVFGGSWGSTLALAYATHHPQPVRGLIMRGIYLCRSSEVRWFYQDGASHVFPEAWEKFLALIPPEERGDLVQAYHRRLTHPDESVRLEAAVSWCVWEASTTHLYPDQESIQEYAEPQKALPLARIENQYLINRAYMKSDTYLLEKAAEINHLPCRIVQGRYDMCCPATSAWELCRAMPRADLRMVPDAGHSALEPGIASELIRATDDFKELYA